jgi:hypothetical protein
MSRLSVDECKDIMSIVVAEMTGETIEHTRSELDKVNSASDFFGNHNKSATAEFNRHVRMSESKLTKK